MVKVVEFFRKRTGMPDDEFYDYWLTGHSRVVLSLDGVLRYVQNHPLPETRAAGGAVFDGVVEIWFESREAMKQNAARPYWKELEADEARFIDRSSLALLLVEEHIIKEGTLPEGAVKSIKPVNRRADMPVPDFQRDWRKTHGPLVAGLPGVLRHVQNHVLPGAYRTGKEVFCDGYGATWFADLNSVKRAGAAPEHRTIDADEARFKGPPAAPAMLVREHIIKA